MSEQDPFVNLAQVCNEEGYEPFLFTDPPKGWGNWLLKEVVSVEKEEDQTEQTI